MGKFDKKLNFFALFGMKLPREIPFLKMYTYMYFLEFVKKLCYKIKMPKRNV